MMTQSPDPEPMRHTTFLTVVVAFTMLISHSAHGASVNASASSVHAATDRNDEWWGRSKTFRAEPYRIHTDLPREDAERYASALVRLHAAFENTLGQLPRRSPGHLNVLLFQSHADYLGTLQTRYEVNAVGTSSLFFQGSESSGVAVWIEDRPQHRVMQLLQSQAFHQYARSRFGTDLPPWISEGLADYFGSAIVTNDHVILGAVQPSLLKPIQDAIEVDAHVPFRELFRMADDEWWNEVHRGRGPVARQQAWSMVHYLLHGDNGRHRSAYRRCLRMIADGVLWDRAFRRAFELDEPDGFERAWRAHVITAEPSPFAAALERIDFLAAGALELSRQSTRPMTLDGLKRELMQIDFQRPASTGGATSTLLARDEEVFAIPSQADIRRRPHFALSEPERRILPRRQRELVAENPEPATIATKNLEPHDLIVRWIRDFETNTLRYEIAFR